MKRLIFAVLWDSGSFMLSRNFRLQRIGDLGWLLRNYRLAEVAGGLDEIMILNVGEDPLIDDVLLAAVRTIAHECFVPVTVGGGIRSVDDAQKLLEVGVDKIVMNTSIHRDPSLCESVSRRFGRQFLVQGIDVLRRHPEAPPLVRLKGGDAPPVDVRTAMRRGNDVGAGEILLQSVDRDGTGMGLDLAAVSAVGDVSDVPLIMMGGVGKPDHVVEGLLDPRIDAVATANLLNFIGDAFLVTRDLLVRVGAPVARPSSPTTSDMWNLLGAG